MLDETAWEEIATALCHAADRLDGRADSWNDFRGRPMGHDWSHGDADAKHNRARAARLRILAFNVADVAARHHDPACALGDALAAAMRDQTGRVKTEPTKEEPTSCRRCQGSS